MMVVYEISCDEGHQFEGWFASSGDFDDQLVRGLVECPMCNSRHVRKVPSAAFVNVSSQQESSQSSAAIDVRALLQLVREQVLANSENVGNRFPDEARKIHYGDAPIRVIRGSATLDEAKSLVDEGIEFLPIPDVSDDNLH
ncbi:DUF1178 family protein [Chitinivorax sp. B]|uniref:DUF1178 family protein n=1 Tax=Chitinivorax sp. B TaxID=2502235 RepID=UPI002017E567|nr:DUF1178 family protein [Chitinivorax sp. B]